MTCSSSLRKDNVAFHVDGSCFYLEDGVEEHNWLEHNIAAYIHVRAEPPLSCGICYVLRLHCCAAALVPLLHNTYKRSCMPSHSTQVIGTPAAGVSQDGSTHVQDFATLEQPADSAASGFYISNPNNALLRNAASGGWAGYSFPRLETPVGEYSWMQVLVLPRVGGRRGASMPYTLQWDSTFCLEECPPHLYAGL